MRRSLDSSENDALSRKIEPRDGQSLSTLDEESGCRNRANAKSYVFTYNQLRMRPKHPLSELLLHNSE
jgi:hypothetical protein